MIIIYLRLFVLLHQRRPSGLLLLPHFYVTTVLVSLMERIRSVTPKLKNNLPLDISLRKHKASHRESPCPGVSPIKPL